MEETSKQENMGRWNNGSVVLAGMVCKCTKFPTS